MNLIDKIRFLRVVADKIREYDLAGTLNHVAEIADQVAAAARHASDLIEEYLGLPTVGAGAIEDPVLDAEIAELESACRAVVSVQSSEVGAVNPAAIAAVIQLIIAAVDLIKKRRGLS